MKWKDDELLNHVRYHSRSNRNVFAARLLRLFSEPESEPRRNKMTACPTSDYVKLISADNFTFVMDRRCAMGSGTIRNMLSVPGEQGRNFDAFSSRLTRYLSPLRAPRRVMQANSPNRSRMRSTFGISKRSSWKRSANTSTTKRSTRTRPARFRSSKLSRNLLWSF